MFAAGAGKIAVIIENRSKSTDRLMKTRYCSSCEAVLICTVWAKIDGAGKCNIKRVLCVRAQALLCHSTQFVIISWIQVCKYIIDLQTKLVDVFWFHCMLIVPSSEVFYGRHIKQSGVSAKSCALSHIFTNNGLMWRTINIIFIFFSAQFSDCVVVCARVALPHEQTRTQNIQRNLAHMKLAATTESKKKQKN